MAMSIDVANYITNIYIENLKKKYSNTLTKCSAPFSYVLLRLGVLAAGGCHREHVRVLAVARSPPP
jgi:hypothetical protein